jgi:hypothetical protein
MKVDRVRPLMRAAAAVLTIVLTGCVTQPQSLYYWDDYQPAVYSYFKGDGTGSPEQQIITLEASAERARAQGAALPPGFNAHLGLLYLKTGKTGQAQQAFRTEEAQFPESKPYMDYLLSKFKQNNG